MSVVVHGVILSVLLIIPLLFTEAIKLRYDTVLIAPPPPHKQILEVTHYKALPPPKVQPKPEKPLVPPPVKPVVVEPPKPKPEPPKIVEVKKPEVIEREKPTPIARNTPKLDTVAPETPTPKLEVRTGQFSTGSSAQPTRTADTGKRAANARRIRSNENKVSHAAERYAGCR